VRLQAGAALPQMFAARDASSYQIASGGWVRNTAMEVGSKFSLSFTVARIMSEEIHFKCPYYITQ